MIYEYQCTKCNSKFEYSQSYKDKPKTKCENCKEKTLEKIISVPHVWVKDYNTVGAYADRQTKNMGTYERQEKQYSRSIEMKETKRLSIEEMKKNLPKGVSIPDASIPTLE